MQIAYIKQLPNKIGEQVTLRGWLYNKRSSGKIQFLQIRDGTGIVQGVITADRSAPEVFQCAQALTQESSLIICGTVRQDNRAPSGCEIDITGIDVVHLNSEQFPIELKQQTPQYLMDHRHLWIRTGNQVPILRIRDAVMHAIRQFFYEYGFIATETPILTGTAVEGTTTLFEMDYFGRPAYLSQSGQLYLEATAMALGRVYWIGPIFRAEKSKTRKHLTEFWMAEAEMAYYDHNDNLTLQQELINYIVNRVIDEREQELATLGRDIDLLRAEVTLPFPRITYRAAIDLLRKKGLEISFGDDFGAPHEEELGNHFGKPVFVELLPKSVKPFYMKRDSSDPSCVLAADLIGPEGYGELIGGSQRVDSLDELKSQLTEENLPAEPYEWYLDLRRYGSVPHSGFGLGVERTIAWICGITHLRETIPFARQINRLYP